MATTYRAFLEKFGGSSAGSFIGNYGDIFYDPGTSTLRISDGSTPGGVIIAGSAANNIAPIVTISDVVSNYPALAGSLNVTIAITSTSSVTATGVYLPFTSVYSTSFDDNQIYVGSNTTGSQIIMCSGLPQGRQIVGLAYATNSSGTGYSAPMLFPITGVCLLYGTMITLANGSYKSIQDITYDDVLLSWNFDRGCYVHTRALSIKRQEIGGRYNLLTFNDGTTLRTFDQHRIFNKQAGKFTYPMTDETPIGTISINEHGKEIIMTDKQYVHDTISYYNVWTDYHINMFADSVLTSCRFNNIYPIKDMKFVKDERVLRSRKEFSNIEDRFFYGLRLSEQSFDIEMIEWYVNRMKRLEIPQSFEYKIAA